MAFGSLVKLDLVCFLVDKPCHLGYALDAILLVHWTQQCALVNEVSNIPTALSSLSLAMASQDDSLGLLFTLLARLSILSLSLLDVVYIYAYLISALRRLFLIASLSRATNYHLEL